MFGTPPGERQRERRAHPRLQMYPSVLVVTNRHRRVAPHPVRVCCCDRTRPDVGARLSLSPVLAASWRPVHHQTAVAGRRPEPREELGRQRTPSAPPPPLTGPSGPWPLRPPPDVKAARGAATSPVCAVVRS